MNNKIDEELRQYKLFKIQEADSKIRRFNKKHQEIKEHIVIKFSKNLTSNIIIIVITLTSFVFLFLGFLFFFPQEIIDSNRHLTAFETKEILETAKLYRYFFISVFVLLSFTSYLLRLNNIKRNHIYSLAMLLEEVMEYMQNTREEDKTKYEQFVELIAQRENNKTFQK